MVKMCNLHLFVVVYTKIVLADKSNPNISYEMDRLDMNSPMRFHGKSALPSFQRFVHFFPFLFSINSFFIKFFSFFGYRCFPNVGDVHPDFSSRPRYMHQLKSRVRTPSNLVTIDAFADFIWIFQWNCTSASFSKFPNLFSPRCFPNVGDVHPDYSSRPRYMHQLKSRVRTPSNLVTIDAFAVKTRQKVNIWEESLPECKSNIPWKSQNHWLRLG